METLLGLGLMFVGGLLIVALTAFLDWLGEP
jgi:hypothetical protein